MSVMQLRKDVGEAAVESVAAAREAVSTGAGLPAEQISTQELGACLSELAGLESQVAAWRLALLAEADRRRVAEETADTGTDAWAAKLTGDTREVMRGGLFLAKELQERFHYTREAFAAGQLRVAQVRVIVNAARQAPPEATPKQVADAEQYLVDQATGVGRRSGRPINASRLRQAARRMFDPIDRELADKHEAILLGREHRHAEAMTYLQLSDNGDGTFSGKFTIPELHGHLFKHALERLTSPRRLSRDASGQVLEDETVSTTNYFENLGAALCELLEHLPATGHAANGVTLLVTMELEKLRSGLGSARLDIGAHISAGEARRLACNAGIVPVVLGGKSRVLDLGRKRRLFDEGQRLALATRHDTCAVAGCHRPFAWCEIHHAESWLHRGRTDLENAVPLCGHHHRRAHDARFDLRRHVTEELRFHARG